MSKILFLNLCNSYTQNGLLHMLDRNKRIKPRPERFQVARDKFDILVTCEERVYDQVIEGTCQLFVF
jgi:RNA polymerase II-interacting protein involved in transcription start site selection